MEALRRPRGRPPSRSWAFFTTETEPQKLPTATCRHCQQLVPHHKKWGQARTHLMKCAPFLQFMESLPPADVPEWYLAEITRRHQNLVLNKNLGSNVPIFQSPPQNASFKSIQPMPGMQMPMVPNAGNSAGKRVQKVDGTQIEENVAMHLFTTLSVHNFAEEKLEISLLARAFQACNASFELPEMEKLMTEVLDRCYEKVNTQVNGFFKSGLVPICLSLKKVPASSDGQLVTVYMASLASSDKYPIYLESVEVPTDGDVDANVGWAANDAARVVKKLSCPVAGCVIPCSSPESRQTRQLLETQFPNMYFHGCVRDALLTIVQQLFVQAEGGEMVPFSRDLQQFALQCKDLAYFVPNKETPSYFRDVPDTQETVHVTVRRRLTVHDGFMAILQAQAFLDVEALGDKFFSSGSAVTLLHKQLFEFVRSPKFSEKLRKYLDVVRPLHGLLSAFQVTSDSSPLPLSEVYSCFAKLSIEFSSSSLLSPGEKSMLKALVQHQQEYVVGTAHELAYLLDPVLLGEDFSIDKKAEVEQKLLMSAVGANGTPFSDAEKDALSTQYKAFQKTALYQKTVKAASEEFQKLKDRTKSPLQFWFSDGAKWPALQAIACRVFVMAACVVSSAPVLSGVGLPSHVLHPKLGPQSSDKLAFVRVNTRQLQLAEVCGSCLASVVPNLQNDSNSNDITASMVV